MFVMFLISLTSLSDFSLLTPLDKEERQKVPKRFRVVRHLLYEPEDAREGEGIQEMGMAL